MIVSKRTTSFRCRMVTAALALSILSSFAVAGERTYARIHVGMDSKQPLSLRVQVRSAAATRITFDKWLLPWGNVHSMILIAVLPNGLELEELQPIDDPTSETISLATNESVSGVIPLARLFKGLEEALKKSDVHLFWAYRAPTELNISRYSGGWILIPRHR